MGRLLTDGNDDTIRREHLGGASLRQLAAKWAVSRPTIAAALHRTQTPIRQVQESLSPQQKQDASQRYAAGESGPSLARAFSVTVPTILKGVRQSGIAIRDSSQAARRHGVNEEAFDHITEESAYWIGFLIADGTVGKAGCINLSLSAKDREHIFKFRTFLQSSHPVRDQPARTMHHRPRNGKIYTARGMASLSIWSQRIAIALRSYGLHESKSYGATVVGLEDNRHFWRGVVDGDGSLIQRSPGKVCAIRLCGSEKLLRQFATFVKTHILVREPKIYHGHPEHIIVVNGQWAKHLIQLLYDPCAVALNRKLALAKEIIKTEEACYQRVPLRQCADWKHLDQSALETLHLELGTWQAVAKHLGMSGGTITDVRRRCGLLPKRIRKSPATTQNRRPAPRPTERHRC